MYFYYLFSVFNLEIFSPVNFHLSFVLDVQLVFQMSGRF